MFCARLGKPSNSINDKQEFLPADSSVWFGRTLLANAAAGTTFRVSPWQQMSLLVCLTLGPFLTSGAHEPDLVKPIFQGAWFYETFNSGSWD